MFQYPFLIPSIAVPNLVFDEFNVTEGLLLTLLLNRLCSAVRNGVAQRIEHDMDQEVTRRNGRVWH